MKEKQLILKKRDVYLAKDPRNKVTNAGELLKAIESEGGLKNASMCVLEINREKTKLKISGSVPNISYFHSNIISENEIKYFEHFKIGEGKIRKLIGKNVHNILLIL